VALASDVAALFIDPRGVYPQHLAHCWDETRDARAYSLDLPVVAHPPCGPWSELRHLYQGAEHDCAPWAVELVRRVGGVLEHPHRSTLWGAAGLPEPGAPLDAWGGFTLVVDQVSWGHVARKRTRLYIVGADRAEIAAEVRTGGTPTHWVSGSRGNPGRRTGGAVPPGIKVCSKQQRNRTPPAFAVWLISIARRCHRPSQVAP
jgi:hypothetical protein